MTNNFNNDQEKILELKACLEEAFKLLSEEEASDKARTLIKDTLSRYEQNKKFITATDTYNIGKLEFLKD